MKQNSNTVVQNETKLTGKGNGDCFRGCLISQKANRILNETITKQRVECRGSFGAFGTVKFESP